MSIRNKQGITYLTPQNSNIYTNIYTNTTNTTNPTTNTDVAVLAKLVDIQSRSLILSISTRGIGLGLCQLCFISSKSREFMIPNVYAMFRVFLGILESKLQSVNDQRPEVFINNNNDKIYKYQIDTSVLKVCQTTPTIPEPIKRIIDAVGVLNYDNKTYIPAVAANRVDENGILIPRPESVLLSNLRQVVESLANPETPEIYRKSFEDNNSIPGAIFDNHVLKNPDEIIPENYDQFTHLRDDMFLLVPYINQLQKYFPKMVQGVINTGYTGRNSIFICNHLHNLRVPPRNAAEPLNEYYQRCIPEGNIRSFHSLYKLSAEELCEGMVNLLGEIPAYENYVTRPIYALRDESICTYSIATEYKAVCQLIFSLLLKDQN